MKKLALVLLKVGITTTLLWMIFREHRFTAAILPHLHSMLRHWGWTLAGLASVGVSTWLGAVRWQWLLRGQGQRFSNGTVLHATVVSSFFNITSLGAAGGDAYRIVALMRVPGAQRLPVVASVMLDHLVGLAGLGALFLGCSLSFRGHWGSFSTEVRALIGGFAVFMGVSTLVLVLSVLSFTPSIYNWGEQKLPRFLGWPPLKRFAVACDALRRSWGCTLAAAGMSVLLYIFHFLSFYCALFAVGGSAPLREVMAAMPVVDALSGLPISVSGLGVREKTFETLMHALTGLSEATAVSASLAGWLMGVVWGLAGGLLFVAGRRARPGA